MNSNMRFLLLLPFFCLLAAFTVGENNGASPVKSEMLSRDKWNFSLKDTAGNIVTLSDLRGKFVVVDLWTSSCKPCLEEAPYTKELQGKFSNDTGKIAWVFISFDPNEKLWKTTVKKQGVAGIHLYGTPVKEDIKRGLDVEGIPRYIWIDADGEIVMKDAPRPSERSTFKQIGQFIKNL
jgi:cytochrome oxidase Cu insertion factor (SCO1/SenC/PrrC family)